MIQDLVNKINNIYHHKELRTNVIYITTKCNFSCEYCVHPDTKILMSDFTVRSIKDVKIGDEIIAFDENKIKNKQRKYQKAIIKNIFKRNVNENLYVLDNILRITGNHQVLGTRSQFHKIETISFKTKNEKIVWKTDLPQIIEIPFSYDYKVGYIIGCWLGDGSIKHYDNSNYVKYDTDGYRLRFVVKDIEITHRLFNFMKEFNIDFKTRSFKISEKYDIDTVAICSAKKETFEKLNKLINDNFRKNDNIDYLKGFLAGIYDCEGSLSGYYRIFNTDIEIINEIKKALLIFNVTYSEDIRDGINKPIIVLNMHVDSMRKAIQEIIPAAVRKRAEYIDCSIGRRIVPNITRQSYVGEVYNLETTTGTYIADGYLVHNCFENDKKKDSNFLNKTCSNQEIDRFVYDMYNREFDNDGRCVTVMGGEPFTVYLKLLILFDTVEKYFGTNTGTTCFCIFTNGSYFGNDKNIIKWKKVLEHYKKYNINPELSISYDGPIGQKLRKNKPGYLEKIIHNLYENNILKRIAYTVNILNYKQSIDDIEYLINKYDVYVQANIDRQNVESLKDFNLNDYIDEFNNRLKNYIEIKKVESYFTNCKDNRNKDYSNIRNYQLPKQNLVKFDTDNNFTFSQIVIN